MRYIVVTVLALAACATQQPPKAALAEQDARCGAGFSSSELDPIRSKVRLGVERPTFEMLADRTYANETEKAAIVALDAKVIECANGFGAIFAAYGWGDYVAAQQLGVVAGQQARLSLYQGKTTFGEYAAQVSAVNAETRERFAVLDRQRQQLAIQQQGAAAASLSAVTPILAPAYQSFTPQAVNCTSSRQGAFTSTTCR